MELPIAAPELLVLVCQAWYGGMDVGKPEHRK